MSITHDTAGLEASARLAAKVAGLRALADFLETHGAVDLSRVYVGANLGLDGDIDAAAAWAVIGALAPCIHGNSNYRQDRYDFVRDFGGGILLKVTFPKDLLFTEAVRETTVYDLPADLAALAEGRVTA